MGRYYQTSQFDTSNNFMYEAPWDFMDKALATYQKNYDDIEASTQMFENALLNIKHLQGPDDVENVNRIRDYYTNKINEITDFARNNPMKALALKNNIRALQQELQKDFTSGNISKIQNSVQALKNWEEENKERMKDSPERYQAAKNHFMQQYLSTGGNSIDNGWSGELVTKDLDWNKIKQSGKDLVANAIKTGQVTPNGNGYFVDINGERKFVDKERLEQYFISQALDPTSLASLRQSQKFGLGQFFDGDGNLNFELSGWKPLLWSAQAQAWEQVSQETKYSVDGTYHNNADRAQKERFHRDNMAWEQFKFEANQRTNDPNSISKLEEKFLFEKDPEIRERIGQEIAHRKGILYSQNVTIDTKNGISDIQKLTGQAKENATRQALESYMKALWEAKHVPGSQTKYKKDEFEKYWNSAEGKAERRVFTTYLNNGGTFNNNTFSANGYDRNLLLEIAKKDPLFKRDAMKLGIIDYKIITKKIPGTGYYDFELKRHVGEQTKTIKTKELEIKNNTLGWGGSLGVRNKAFQTTNENLKTSSSRDVQENFVSLSSNGSHSTLDYLKSQFKDSNISAGSWVGYKNGQKVDISELGDLNGFSVRGIQNGQLGEMNIALRKGNDNFIIQTNNYPIGKNTIMSIIGDELRGKNIEELALVSNTVREIKAMSSRLVQDSTTPVRKNLKIAKKDFEVVLYPNKGYSINIIQNGKPIPYRDNLNENEVGKEMYDIENFYN